MKRFLAAVFCMALFCSLTGCKSTGESSAEFYAMDTTMNVTAYGTGAKSAVSETQAKVDRLEALLSRTRSDSEVSAINSGAADAPVAVSIETAGLLNAAWSYSHTTNGAFDITIAPVVSAWGFTTDHYQVPTQPALDALLNAVDYTGVLVEGISSSSARVTLRKGQAVDLGGIAKGYASDCVEAILAENGVERAMASLGGNIYVRGTKPDGSAWRVGVQDPDRSGGFVGVLSLSDAFAVTSGGYQRYFEQDGKRYHHIIDPATGYPAESGLTSVTIVADGNKTETPNTPGNGTMCDAFSTAMFVMGEEKAAEFWRSGAYNFQMVLVTEDGRVLVTDGLADKFEQEDGSGYAYETISRTPS